MSHKSFSEDLRVRARPYTQSNGGATLHILSGLCIKAKLDNKGIDLNRACLVRPDENTGATIIYVE